MRKFIAFVLVEAALLCAATYLSMLTTIAPVWIWPIVSVVCLILAALLYAPEIKRWFFRKGSQTATPAMDSQLSKVQEKMDRLLGYMRRMCDVGLEGRTKFKAMEATVTVGKRKPNKPTSLLTLRRCLGKLVPW